MAIPNLPLDGGCRCGRVRFRAEAPPILTGVCHCTGCQRMTGGAFSVSAAFRSDSFTVTQGEPVIGGLHGAQAHHSFCPWCMSWLFTRPEGLDWFVNVRATMFDETGWYAPFMETYTSERLSWATAPAVHSYERFPEPEEYGALLKEFAERSSR